MFWCKLLSIAQQNKPRSTINVPILDIVFNTSGRNSLILSISEQFLVRTLIRRTTIKELQCLQNNDIKLVFLNKPQNICFQLFHFYFLEFALNNILAMFGITTPTLRENISFLCKNSILCNKTQNVVFSERFVHF